MADPTSAEPGSDPADASAGPGPWGWSHLVAILGMTLLMALILRGMGRVWWCHVGDVRFWAGDVWSTHNSQHPLDPYAFTHVLHGFLFHAILWVVLARWLDEAGRGVLAVAGEALWEILENTPAVIESYREATMALNYYGDAVVNSVGDVAAFVLGYLLARRLPVPASIGVFLGVEAILLVWIRDGLILNVLMLLWPIEAVKAWQMAPVG